MIPVKTLGLILQDMLFSLCAKELKLDFIEIKNLHQFFLSRCSATAFIEENPQLHFMSPQEFVNNYQAMVDSYLTDQITRCQRILIEKKYLFYLLKDKERFYAMFKKEYAELFNIIDITLAKESHIIQAKVIEGMKELHEGEVH